MANPSDSIDVEAGLIRDHDSRGLLTGCRYALAVIVVITLGATWSCQERAPVNNDCGTNAPCALWQGRAQECQKHR